MVVLCSFSKSEIVSGASRSLFWFLDVDGRQARRSVVEWSVVEEGYVFEFIRACTCPARPAQFLAQFFNPLAVATIETDFSLLIIKMWFWKVAWFRHWNGKIGTQNFVWRILYGKKGSSGRQFGCCSALCHTKWYDHSEHPIPEATTVVLGLTPGPYRTEKNI